MKTAAVLTIGSEIVEGIILNTNAQYICQKLVENGYTVKKVISVDDEEDSIKEEIQRLLKSCDVIVVSGGLGPTEDDRTREAIASSLSRQLIVDEQVKRKIYEKVSRYYSALPKNLERQALVIQGAQIIPNPVGTAPGQLIEFEGKKIVLLPGPPQEMRPMLDSVLEQLKTEQDFKTIKMLFFGVPESVLDQFMTDAAVKSCVKIATQASFGEGVWIRLTAPLDCFDEAQKLSQKLVEKFRLNFIGYGETSVEKALFEELKSRKLTFSVAESCTGGLVCSKMVSVPGASQVFVGGIVAYDNSVKIKTLNVPEETIERFGAVSERCVVEMAHGVKKLTNSDLAVAVSGIAGPTGGSEEKPVGTAYFCVTDGQKDTVEKIFYPQERNIFRARVATHALFLLLIRVRGMI
ncbi:CinA family nicotinamide mononucleotide deamidase-related protein [Thermotoga caldifontis]|uniref:CinA family nicotinamide mononucleotide deamidase-related protein n=1 Tax=Thermotoga caldifontis TaxID=1508419 RepID=UPI000596DE32|nr:CinA family nicotinamide mononucleotide deamidase-related protein [Thermotoga caldifontis]